MLRYVGAFLGVKVFAFICLASISLFIEEANDLPDLSTPITIMGVYLAMAWFNKREARRPKTEEIWLFAIGAALADMLLGFGYIVAGTLTTADPFTVQGASEFMGFDLPESEVRVALVVGGGVGFFTTLFTSAIFAWLCGKYLLKHDPEEGQK